MAHYIGIIHKDPDTEFGVSFPDFPGCISAGSDLAEVAVMGEEALTFHIEGMREDGDEIPDPMTMDEARVHEFAESAVAFILVKVDDPADKSIRLNITMPESVVKAVDSYAKQHGLSRSAFLARAAKDALTAA